MNQKTNKSYFKTAIIAVILITVFLLIYMVTRATVSADEKTITIEIVHGTGDSTSEELQTTLEYLGDLLLEEQLAFGEDGPYGLYIQTVDGETANESAQEWWCITKDGEMHLLSASETALADGDKYELTLKTGYDE